MSWFKQTMARWDQVKAEYGKIAIWTYLTLWVLVLGAFFLAIKSGVDVDGAGEASSALFGAWLAAKVTQPVRIAATIVLTPMVAKMLRKDSTQPTAGEE
jgi:hypothetical protein